MKKIIHIFRVGFQETTDFFFCTFQYDKYIIPHFLNKSIKTFSRRTINYRGILNYKRSAVELIFLCQNIYTIKILSCNFRNLVCFNPINRIQSLAYFKSQCTLAAFLFSRDHHKLILRRI